MSESAPWTERALGDLVRIKHGFAFPGEHFVDWPTGYSLVTPGNFEIGGGFRRNRKPYAGPIPEEYVLAPGDLIVTMTDLSQNGDTLGYSAVVPADDEVLLHNQRIGLVQPVGSDEADLGFLGWVMRSLPYRQEILATATGSTVRHTSPSRIEAYRFRLPPIAQQRAIDGVLSVLDEKIELSRRLVARAWSLIENICRAVVARSIEAAKPLGEVVEFNYGKSLTKSMRRSGRVPVVGSGGVDGHHDVALVEGPVVVVGRAGQPGRVHLLLDDCWPIDSAFWVSPVAPLPIALVWFLLQDLDLGRLQSGSAVPGLNRAIALGEQVVVPDSEALRELERETAPLLAIVRQAESESAALAALRDALLPELLSGRLLVREAEAVVEGVV